MSIQNGAVAIQRVTGRPAVEKRSGVFSSAGARARGGAGAQCVVRSASRQRRRVAASAPYVR